MEPPSDPALTCSHCGETFQRREHRNRHELRHTGARPFTCSVCSKSFSRKSQRCDGFFPCSRCLCRESECTYRSGLDETSDEVVVSETLLSFRDQPSDNASRGWPATTSDPVQDSQNQALIGTQTEWLQDPVSPELLFGSDGFGNRMDGSLLMWNPPIASFPFSWSVDTLDFALEGSSPLDAAGMSQSLDHSSPAQQSSKLHLKPENICGGQTMPCGLFPNPQPDDPQTAEAEIYDHISSIPDSAVQGLHRFYASQQLTDSPVGMPPRILHAFVELYFEHFAWQFPFLHPSRLEAPKLSWILLLAVAAVGSHYSELAAADKYSVVLCDLLARAIESAGLSNRTPGLVVVQSTFLLHVIWAFSASQRDRALGQHRQSSLAARCLELTVPASRSREPSEGSEDAWQLWLAGEERLRTTICIRGKSQATFENRHQIPRQPSVSQVDDSQPSISQDQVLLDSLSLALDSKVSRPETLLHVLFILRHVSLATLHSATGWQTTKEQMLKSKTLFRDFFRQHGPSARRCLLYAVQVLNVCRNTRLGACYNVFSVMVAMSYVYCYSELCTLAAPSMPASGNVELKRSRAAIVRLDQLQDKAAIEQWIDIGTDSLVHLTGVGVLDGPDACVRFLRDVEKTMHSQIAWHGICRAFAGSFAQLRRGETPTKDPPS
ncbi:hypothetical protein Micbo1qcDRAFT_218775 [Microdochium bolleyi]|uniref:C2H2-type domain-containing protein n=1 Tax=Microdochium bolleyi TaxID=196109 RepID=A0A136IPZ8_9PEZI|nr:hypothetical protein Micbo1qcDRAFT_218775 [Microdochium bolleyi]